MMQSMCNLVSGRFSLFSLGFRPFFLLTGFWAVIAMAGWLHLFALGGSWFDLWQDSTVWHGHEMIFGYTGAVIAGFLLTATPNWTKARPVRTWRLVALCLLWVTGRIAMGMAGSYPLLAAIVDGAFLPTLALVLVPAVVRTRKRRNYIFFALLLLMAACNVTVHGIMAGWWQGDARHWLYVAVHMIVLMISVFAGRIVPVFTHNALKVEGRTVGGQAPAWLDGLAVGLLGTLTLVAAWQGFDGWLVAGLAFMAATTNLLRMRWWHGWKAWDMPIVWILHVGSLALVAGLVLEGLAAGWGLVPFSVALHGLTVGAIGMMTLAMMTRVSLGHSGRQLKITRLILLAYLLLLVSFMVRLGGVAQPVDYRASVLLSGWLWIAAFGLFTAVYLPILWRPRADGRPD